MLINSGANDVRVEFGQMPGAIARVLAAGAQMEMQAPPADALFLQAVGGSSDVGILSY